MRLRRQTVTAPGRVELQMAQATRPQPVEAFEGQLPSEHVLWSGRPAPLAYAYQHLSPAFPVGLGLFVFTAVWELVARSSGDRSLWAAVGLVFFAVGVHAALVRPLLLIRAARRRAYAVTDLRVVHLRRSSENALVVESESAWRPPFAAVRVGPGGATIGVADVTFAGSPVRRARWGWWGVGEDGDSLAGLTDAPSAVLALAQLRAGAATPAGAWTRGVRTP